MRNDLGGRLRQIRASKNQQEMADSMGVAKRTYASYERNERVPDAHVLQRLHAEGWNINWLLSGEGLERLDMASQGIDASSRPNSQAVRQGDLTIAVTLAQEALDGRTLSPAKYGQLVALIYDALVNGLPSAQVLAFAQPAARGLREGESDGESSSVGGSGQRTAGRG